MKIPPVRAELFCADRQTDRQTNVSKLIVAFRNFVNAPKTVQTEYEIGINFEIYVQKISLKLFLHLNENSLMKRSGHLGNPDIIFLEYI